MDLYHYTECGLDDIWLADGVETETFGDYGAAVAVPGEKQLWAVLALGIANQNRRMTGQELRFLRTLMTWTQTDLGRHLGYGDGQTVAKWEKSRHDAVPVAADTFLRGAYRESIGQRAMLVQTSARLLEQPRATHAAQRRVLTRLPSGEWRQKEAPAEMEFA